mgnify:CR=1 FL=1
MPFDAHSGERLRSERERLGLTQQAMADAAGVRREMWSKYERGVAVPGGDVFEALAGLRVDLMFVLTGDYLSVAQAKAVAGISNSPTSANLPPDEQLLLEAYRGMAAPARKELLAELLTGGKKPKAKPQSEGGIKVTGSGHRVAGRDFNETKE